MARIFYKVHHTGQSCFGLAFKDAHTRDKRLAWFCTTTKLFFVVVVVRVCACTRACFRLQLELARFWLDVHRRVRQHQEHIVVLHDFASRKGVRFAKHIDMVDRDDKVGQHDLADSLACNGKHRQRFTTATCRSQPDPKLLAVRPVQVNNVRVVLRLYEVRRHCQDQVLALDDFSGGFLVIAANDAHAVDFGDVVPALYAPLLCLAADSHHRHRPVRAGGIAEPQAKLLRTTSVQVNLRVVVGCRRRRASRDLGNVGALFGNRENNQRIVPKEHSHFLHRHAKDAVAVHSKYGVADAELAVGLATCLHVQHWDWIVTPSGVAETDTKLFAAGPVQRDRGYAWQPLFQINPRAHTERDLIRLRNERRRLLHRHANDAAFVDRHDRVACNEDASSLAARIHVENFNRIGRCLGVTETQAEACTSGSVECDSTDSHRRIVDASRPRSVIASCCSSSGIGRSRGSGRCVDRQHQRDHGALRRKRNKVAHRLANYAGAVEGDHFVPLLKLAGGNPARIHHGNHHGLSWTRRVANRDPKLLPAGAVQSHTRVGWTRPDPELQGLRLRDQPKGLLHRQAEGTDPINQLNTVANKDFTVGLSVGGDAKDGDRVAGTLRVADFDAGFLPVSAVQRNVFFYWPVDDGAHRFAHLHPTEPRLDRGRRCAFFLELLARLQPAEPSLDLGGC